MVQIPKKTTNKKKKRSQTIKKKVFSVPFPHLSNLLRMLKKCKK